MIVWTGLGFLVPVILFAGVLAAEIITEAITGDASYYQENSWPMIAGFVVAAIVLDLVNRRIKTPRERFVVDQETGERLVISEPSHTFFFIPIRYWPVLLLVIGGAIALWPDS